MTTRKRTRRSEGVQYKLDFVPPISRVVPPAVHEPQSILKSLLGPGGTAQFECAELDQVAEVLADHLGVRVRRCNMNTSGQLLYDSEVPTILLNDRHQWRRQRYTLAHELGHLLILRALRRQHHGDLVTQALIGGGYSHKIERFVDRLAAEVLLPLVPFAQEAEALDRINVRGFTAVWRLRQRFGATQTAVLCRLADIRTDYLALQCSWRATSRKPESLRVQWSVGSQTRLGHAAVGKSVPYDGPISESFRTRAFHEGFMDLTSVGKDSNVCWVESAPSGAGSLSIIDVRVRDGLPPATELPRFQLSYGQWRPDRHNRET